jgi:hypothetical protein
MYTHPSGIFDRQGRNFLTLREGVKYEAINLKTN